MNQYKIQFRAVDGDWRDVPGVFDTEAQAERASIGIQVDSRVPGKQSYRPETRVVEYRPES